MAGPRPFSIDVDAALLSDIQTRVRQTTWPKTPATAGWNYGADIAYVKELCAYWANEFSWPKAQAALNAFPQFIASATVEDAPLALHYYHVRSPRPDAKPLIISHGWPGSVFEFLHLLEPLTNPPAGEPAFHVVVPSLPGYGWSEAPANPISPRRIAAYFDDLMTSVLGYDGYLAQGGDWGGNIAGWLAYDHGTCKAAHFNIMGWLSPSVAPETEEEQAHAAKANAVQFFEGAYFNMQIAKPMSLAVGLEDSPAGWAAYVLEKMHGWSHTKGENIESAYTKDQLLTNIMIYLVTGTVGTALWPYRGIMEDSFGTPLKPGDRITKPVGIAKLPFEVPIYAFPPRSQVEKHFANIVQWTEFAAGGHFAALEQPEAFLADVRSFAKKID